MLIEVDLFAKKVDYKLQVIVLMGGDTSITNGV